MIDLKECERVKELLEKQPDRYREIIEDTFLGVCITDDRGVFTAVNSNYCAMYGYKKQEMIGQSFLMVVQKKQKESLQELHDLFMKLRDEIMRNWVVVRKDGRTFPIFADAGYSPHIEGKPHKVTFVWPKDEDLQALMQKPAS